MHYGGRHVTDNEIRAAAKAAGVPFGVYASLIDHESGRDVKAKSPAGARGAPQVMPDTGPPTLEFGARYLRQQYDRFGSWRLALAAYNAGPGAVVEYGGVPPFRETQRYVTSVLRDAATKYGKMAAQQGAANTSRAAPEGFPPFTSGAPRDAKQTLLGSVLSNLDDMRRGEYDPVKAQDRLVSSVREESLRPQVPDIDLGAPDAPAPQRAPVAAGGTESADWQKWVTVPPRSGSGVGTRPPVLQFVAGMAQDSGEPLAVWDNSRHSKFTVDGNISAHWTGWAVDVPAVGSRNRQLGYIALVRAGMGPEEARKAAARGGIFNVGDKQIIFGCTGCGGDHTDHVHVGFRGRS